MQLVAAELVESREILPGQWLQTFHAPALTVGSRAGQFVHIRPGDFSGLILRRPFSFNTVDRASGQITIHYRAVGRGTDWFTRLRPGDSVDMLGPLGQPFEVDPRSRHLLLIAGGLGMAGVRILADDALRAGREVTLLFGAAGATEVYPSTLLPTRSSTSWPPTTGRSATRATSPSSSATTRAGPTRRSPAGRGRCSPPWPGSPPAATRARRRHPRRQPNGAAGAAPRRPSNPASPAARRRAFLQVSMEQNMGCAVGACLGCVVMDVDGTAPARLPRGPGLRLRRARLGVGLVTAPRPSTSRSSCPAGCASQPDPGRLRHVRLRHRVRRRRRHPAPRRDLLQGHDPPGARRQPHAAGHRDAGRHAQLDRPAEPGRRRRRRQVRPDLGRLAGAGHRQRRRRVDRGLRRGRPPARRRARRRRHRAQHQLSQRRGGRPPVRHRPRGGRRRDGGRPGATDLPLLVKLSPERGRRAADRAGHRGGRRGRDHARSTPCRASPSIRAGGVRCSATSTAACPARPSSPSPCGSCTRSPRSCDIPIVAIGGVAELDDVLDFLAVGAIAVQVGTVLFADPTLPVRLVDELADECGGAGLDSYLPLVGTALPRRSSPLAAPSSKGVEYRP